MQEERLGVCMMLSRESGVVAREHTAIMCYVSGIRRVWKAIYYFWNMLRPSFLTCFLSQWIRLLRIYTQIFIIVFDMQQKNYYNHVVSLPNNKARSASSVRRRRFAKKILDFSEINPQYGFKWETNLFFVFTGNPCAFPKSTRST